MSRDEKFLAATTLLFVAGCTTGGGASGADPAAADDDPTALCEVHYAHQHNPDWNYFVQDITVPGVRRYECTTLNVEPGSTEQELRARLEPWCRERLDVAMRSSQACGTPLRIPAGGVSLHGAFGTNSEGLREYTLTGEAEVVD